MKRILVLALILTSASTLFADIAQPDRFSQDIKIINLDEYPDYEFYFMYAYYHYDMGYQISHEEERVMENGKAYETSSRYNPVQIYARHKKKKKNRQYFHHSEESIGGSKYEGRGDDDKVATYRIRSMHEGIITLERVKLMEDGDSFHIVPKGESDPGPTSPDEQKAYQGKLAKEMSWYFWLLPSICLVSLVGFFLLRARKNRTAA